MRALCVLVLTASLLTPVAAEATGIRVGREVPDMMFYEAGTKRPLPLSVTTDDAKLTVLVFLAPNCRVSDAYLDTLKEMAGAWDKKGVRFLGVASGVDLIETHVAAHAAHHDLPFPVVVDDGQLMANILGASEAPAAFILDEDRRLVYKGRIDDSRGRPRLARDNTLASAVEALLNFDTPPMAATRVRGCGIRRR
jgi:thiol-disulfide isomerase/thioredoxin